MQATDVVDRTAAPAGRPVAVLDVRTLGPPNPLVRTLESVEQTTAETVLVQRNDRVPQFLFPKLDDRGYDYESIETDDEVFTAIWKP